MTYGLLGFTHPHFTIIIGMRWYVVPTKFIIENDVSEIFQCFVYSKDSQEFYGYALSVTVKIILLTSTFQLFTWPEGSAEV